MIAEHGAGADDEDAAAQLIVRPLVRAFIVLPEY